MMNTNEMHARACFLAQSGYTKEEMLTFVNTLLFCDLIDKTIASEMLDLHYNYQVGILTDTDIKEYYGI